MKYEFLLSDLDEKLDELELWNYGREYAFVAEHDGEEFYVDQFVYWCPDLNLSFREGAASSKESDDFECNIVAVYNGCTDLIEDVQDIYSDVTLQGVIIMIAHQRQINPNTIRCVLSKPD